jgi:segregation and condensation protein B
MRMLLERKFIRILGRKDIPGRPMIYGTTRYFLEVFDLKDLKDLPTPKEIDALGKASSEAGEKPPEDDAVSAMNYPVSEAIGSTASNGNQSSAEKNGKNT